MPELFAWTKTLVIQRDVEHGCIPAGYEWMIRYAEIGDVALETFQEDFNLARKGQGQNDFGAIAAAVHEAYPHVKIVCKSFAQGHGSEKVESIEDLIERQIPCLISLSLQRQPQRGKCHIAPVVYVDDKTLRLIWRVYKRVDETCCPEICEIERTQVIQRHDSNEWPGGDDIAWLEPTR